MLYKGYKSVLCKKNSYKLTIIWMRIGLVTYSIPLLLCNALLQLDTIYQWYQPKVDIELQMDKQVFLYNTTTIQASIRYQGFFFIGHYELLIPDAFIDEAVTSSSFGVEDTNFVYSVDYLSRTKQNAWRYSTSFFSLFPTTKQVTVVVTATKEGVDLPVQCGTGGGHFKDCNDITYIEIVKQNK